MATETGASVYDPAGGSGTSGVQIADAIEFTVVNTTSSTTLTAGGAGSFVVASATGILADMYLTIDVGTAQETVQVASSYAGDTTVTTQQNVQNAHSGTWAVVQKLVRPIGVIGDPGTVGNVAAVLAPGSSGSFALAVQGVTSGTPISVSTQPVAPTRSTGTITTSASAITATIGNMSSAVITIHGTYAGVTFSIQASDDSGTTYYTVAFSPENTLGPPLLAVTPGTNATASYGLEVAGYTNIKVLASAYTSGTANVAINLSPVSIPCVIDVIVGNTTTNPIPIAATTWGTATIGNAVAIGSSPSGNVIAVQGATGGLPQPVVGLNCEVLLSATFNRPANTTTYASGQLFANSTTAGSVVALTWTSAIKVAGDAVRVERARITTNSTTITNGSFLLHLFDGSAIPVSAVGDGTAFNASGVLQLTSGILHYAGNIPISLQFSGTGGATGIGVPSAGSGITISPSSGTSIWGFLEIDAAYVPTSGETITVYLECYRT